MRVVLQRSAWGVQYYLRSRGDQIGAASCRMFYWRTSGALIKPLSDGKLTWQRPSGAAKNYRPAADFHGTNFTVRFPEWSIFAAPENYCHVPGSHTSIEAASSLSFSSFVNLRSSITTASVSCAVIRFWYDIFSLCRVAVYILAPCGWFWMQLGARNKAC